MKKTLLRILAVTLVIALALPCAAFAADDINVTVAGETVIWTDAKPFIDENSRTLVPLGDVAKAMGLDVTWDAEARAATFTMQDSYTDPDIAENSYEAVYTLTFTIGGTVAVWKDTYTYADGMIFTDDGEIEMDTAAVISEDRTYAPIRYLAENFGYTADWDAATRTVIIEEDPGASLYWDYCTLMPEYVGIYFYPGELYNEAEKTEIVAARVNGVEATFEIMDAAWLATFNEDWTAGAVYAFYINYDFDCGTDLENPPTYEIEWDIQWTNADGTVDPELETCSWTWECDGYGGY